MDGLVGLKLLEQVGVTGVPRCGRLQDEDSLLGWEGPAASRQAVGGEPLGVSEPKPVLASMGGEELNLIGRSPLMEQRGCSWVAAKHTNVTRPGRPRHDRCGPADHERSAKREDSRQRQAATTAGHEG